MMRAAEPARVVREALAWVGTPYLHQASLRGAGADCLGLARGVWRALHGFEPEPLPPYSRDWGEVGAREVLRDAADRWMLPIPLAESGAGALVLFRMRPGAAAKHCGILIGDGRMVHARSGSGVGIESLSPFWRRRAAFAYAYPEDAAWRP
jgi:NlpC/P60 family putative phage cell wall peptidase